MVAKLQSSVNEIICWNVGESSAGKNSSMEAADTVAEQLMDKT
jgi:hypothetical protein